MDEPTSLGTRRALAEDDCSKWTPRELLAHVLHQLDTGSIVPDGMMVCYFMREGGYTRTGMLRAKATVMETVAMIEMTKHDLLTL